MGCIGSKTKKQFMSTINSYASTKIGEARKLKSELESWLTDIEQLSKDAQEIETQDKNKIKEHDYQNWKTRLRRLNKLFIRSKNDLEENLEKIKCDQNPGKFSKRYSSTTIHKKSWSVVGWAIQGSFPSCQ